MKVGLITFQRSVNYGAFLQARAMIKALRSLGHDVIVIDYQPAHRRLRVRPFFSFRRFYFYRSNLVRIPLARKFRRAIETDFPLSKFQYKSYERLRNENLQLDAIVCGSDQIWNAAHTGGSLDPAYFGCFGPPGANRIAYAASLGSGAIAQEHSPKFVELSANLSHLSVREDAAATQIRTLTRRPCYVVPDPTFLGSDYDTSSTLETPKHYILTYRVQDSKSFNKCAEFATKTLGLPIVHVADNWPPPGGTRSVLMPDPNEWTVLIAKASYVVTNSFHGTVFSVLNQRRFSSIGLAGAHAPSSLRMRTILRRLKLEHQFCSDAEAFGPTIGSSEHIAWDSVLELVELERQRGLGYLKTALGM